MSWEDSIKLKVPALLKKKINALMEKVGFISKLNESSVLHKNEKGLLPIEEAIEVRNEEAVASGGGRVDEASTVNELASDQAKKTPIVKEPHKTSFPALAGTSNAL